MKYPIIIPSDIHLVAYKTIQHEIIDCNPAYLKSTGIKSLDALCGLTDLNLPWQSYADIYHKHENDCLSGKIYSAIQPCCNPDGKIRMVLDTKIPLFNAKKEVIGLTSLSVNVNNSYFFELFKVLEENKNIKILNQYFIGKDSHNCSQREMECLFYLLRGKTAKGIGKILNISARTVEMYISKLKIKFGCLSKAELIEKAIENGYMVIIPPSLLNEELIHSLK